MVHLAQIFWHKHFLSHLLKMSNSFKWLAHMTQQPQPASLTPDLFRYSSVVIYIAFCHAVTSVTRPDFAGPREFTDVRLPEPRWTVTAVLVCMQKCVGKYSCLVVFTLTCGLTVLVHVCVIVCMMATAPNSLADSLSSNGPLALNIVANVTFYTKSWSSATRGKKAKVTSTKEMRAKNFCFCFAPIKPNYIAFLLEILNKHHLSKFKVSDQAVYPCKVCDARVAAFL